MRRACILLAVLATTLASRAQQAEKPQPPTLGGHIGFLLPLVTDTSGNTTSLADAPAVAFPVGIEVKGSGHYVYSLEFVPQYNATGQRLTTLTVHPGVLYGFGGTWAVGLRAAFDVNQPSVGFTPLLHKNFPIKNQGGLLKAYYVEADLPVRFNRPVNASAANAVTFGLQFGVAF
jgi:opacity protein-like surface antigen